MRVIVAREASEARRFVCRLRDLGWDATALECLRIESTLSDDRARALAQQLPRVYALMAVSANAARGFWTPILEKFCPPPTENSTSKAIDLIAPDLQHWCTGTGTADAVRVLGARPDRIICPGIGKQQDSEALWQALQPDWAAIPKNAWIWIARGVDADGTTGRPWFAEQIRAQGLRVDEHVVYRRMLMPLQADQVQSVRESFSRGDTWVFANGALLRHVISQAQPDLDHVRIRTTHPRIADLAKSLGAQHVDDGDLGNNVEAWAASLKSAS